ncbi:response regulator transcription factor [Vallitalea pronyensis]|uniref:Stage 0 sporulation protein A homolog n=1 Tax=Vallitalea pronyensis TaxID=1348613 RepID=A0A8J8MKS5_9FIRM|nr:response regulator transcription factor [Vallitalea pronyensis]QUI23314.1 response regulator transcription factor [Vallitalea pronyensis]
MHNNRILLVEDDTSISDMVRDYLELEGFVVTPVFDGEQGVAVFSKNTFDLVILDLMLPKLSGIEIMEIMRHKSLIPILIMSAKDSDVDKAVGLGLGADDYISKPFSMIELTARVKALIRRAAHYTKADGQENIIHVHDLSMDLNNFCVYKHGQDVKLTSKEFDIMKLFITNKNRVFTKAQIYNLIWGDDYYGEENVINVHMRRLREKIEDNPSTPMYIKTIWGIGYKLGEF